MGKFVKFVPNVRAEFSVGEEGSTIDNLIIGFLVSSKGIYDVCMPTKGMSLDASHFKPEAIEEIVRQSIDSDPKIESREGEAIGFEGFMKAGETDELCQEVVSAVSPSIESVANVGQLLAAEVKTCDTCLFNPSLKDFLSPTCSKPSVSKCRKILQEKFQDFFRTNIRFVNCTMQRRFEESSNFEDLLDNISFGQKNDDRVIAFIQSKQTHEKMIARYKEEIRVSLGQVLEFLQALSIQKDWDSFFEGAEQKKNLWKKAKKGSLPLSSLSSEGISQLLKSCEKVLKKNAKDEFRQEIQECVGRLKGLLALLSCLEDKKTIKQIFTEAVALQSDYYDSERNLLRDGLEKVFHRVVHRLHQWFSQRFTLYLHKKIEMAFSEEGIVDPSMVDVQAFKEIVPLSFQSYCDLKEYRKMMKEIKNVIQQAEERLLFEIERPAVGSSLFERVENFVRSPSDSSSEVLDDLWKHVEVRLDKRFKSWKKEQEEAEEERVIREKKKQEEKNFLEELQRKEQEFVGKEKELVGKQQEFEREKKELREALEQEKRSLESKRQEILSQELAAKEREKRAEEKEKAHAIDSAEQIQAYLEQSKRKEEEIKKAYEELSRQELSYLEQLESFQKREGEVRELHSWVQVKEQELKVWEENLEKREQELLQEWEKASETSLQKDEVEKIQEEEEIFRELITSPSLFKEVEHVSYDFMQQEIQKSSQSALFHQTLIEESKILSKNLEQVDHSKGEEDSSRESVVKRVKEQAWVCASDCEQVKERIFFLFLEDQEGEGIWERYREFLRSNVQRLNRCEKALDVFIEAEGFEFERTMGHVASLMLVNQIDIPFIVEQVLKEKEKSLPENRIEELREGLIDCYRAERFFRKERVEKEVEQGLFLRRLGEFDRFKNSLSCLENIKVEDESLVLISNWSENELIEESLLPLEKMRKRWRQEQARILFPREGVVEEMSEESRERLDRVKKWISRADYVLEHAGAEKRERGWVDWRERINGELLKDFSLHRVFPLLQEMYVDLSEQRREVSKAYKERVDQSAKIQSHQDDYVDAKALVLQELKDLMNRPKFQSMHEEVQLVSEAWDIEERMNNCRECLSVCDEILVNIKDLKGFVKDEQEGSAFEVESFGDQMLQFLEKCRGHLQLITEDLQGKVSTEGPELAELSVHLSEIESLRKSSEQSLKKNIPLLEKAEWMEGIFSLGKEMMRKVVKLYSWRKSSIQKYTPSKSSLDREFQKVEEIHSYLSNGEQLKKEAQVQEGKRRELKGDDFLIDQDGSDVEGIRGESRKIKSPQDIASSLDDIDMASLLQDKNLS